jgi:hypothetical protein
MKIVFFSLLLAVGSVISVKAQRNTLLVYGNVGFDSQKAGSTTTNSYNFSPGIGYQWNDQWTGGVNLGVGSSDAGTGKSSVFSVGPFVRYTQPLAGIFVIYGQLNANYVSNGGDAPHFSGFNTALFPAIGVNLKNGFALNFTVGSLSFNSYTFDKADNTTNSFHFGFGSGTGFGISKNFSLKK